MNTAFTNDLKAGMTLESALKKHNLTLKDAMGISKKGTSKAPTTDQYIYWSKTGYTIIKNLKGTNRYFGTYDTLTEARIVRNELIKCNWDKKEVLRILRTNGIWFMNRNGKCYGDKYIHQLPSGSYNITKKFGKADNTVVVNGGTYATIEDARIIRDELVKINWNIIALDEIKHKHGILDSNGR